MIIAILCLVSLSGSVHTQQLKLVFTEADVDTLTTDLNLNHPNADQLKTAVCNNLQLAIEVAAGE